MLMTSTFGAITMIGCFNCATSYRYSVPSSGSTRLTIASDSSSVLVRSRMTSCEISFSSISGPAATTVFGTF